MNKLQALYIKSRNSISIILLILFTLSFSFYVKGEEQSKISPVESKNYVDTVYSEGSFQLAKRNYLAVIYVGSRDYPGVFRATRNLQAYSYTCGHL